MDSRLRGSDGVVAGAQPMPPCRSRAPLSFPRPLVVPAPPCRSPRAFLCKARGALGEGGNPVFVLLDVSLGV
jgi:hypothetical protein